MKSIDWIGVIGNSVGNIILRFLMTKETWIALNIFQAQAKFDLERAQTAMDWIGQLTGKEIALKEGQLKDSDEFGEILKNGHLLCE